jgi:hypothetical protein
MVSVLKLLFLQQQIGSRKRGEYQMGHSIVDLLIRPGAFVTYAMHEEQSLKYKALVDHLDLVMAYTMAVM